MLVSAGVLIRVMSVLGGSLLHALVACYTDKESLGAPTDLSTLILVQGDEYYLYSAAALRTMALLDQPYRSLAAFHAIPEFIRDAAYKFVAVSSCATPSCFWLSVLLCDALLFLVKRAPVLVCWPGPCHLLREC